jgi:ABC-2 type transport system permease protein
MTHGRKIWVIATFEFLTAVKRPGYLIATFGMPVFMALYAGVIALPAYFMSRADKEEVSIYGVIDTAGILNLQGDTPSEKPQLPEEIRRAIEKAGATGVVDEQLGKAGFIFRPFAQDADARAALVNRSVKGYFVLPRDYVSSGVVEVYTPDQMNLTGDASRNAFSNLVRQGLIRGRLAAPVDDRVLHPLKDERTFSVSSTGELTNNDMTTEIVRIAVPVVFMVLFLLSVLMTSGYLMQGTATEKENKVVEVLLASADPDEILSGKLVGLGGAGLLQVAVWMVLLVGGGIGIIPLLLTSNIEVPWLAVVLAVPLFLMAFLFFGSLMLGTGSLGSNMREAQQLAMVWSLTAALPMMMMAALLREPHGIVSRVMTFLPFSMAPLIIFRASTDRANLAWWEIAGSFAVLMLSTWVAIRVGARLFRVGLLSASRPKLREILRQARLSS